MRLREYIQWLIDKYQHEVDELREDIPDFGGQFTSGVLQTYELVIRDLAQLLED